jgi:cytosine/adenosine deaminase-related metal-dependent hydrolase
MNLSSARPVTFIEALGFDASGTTASSLRVAGGRIVASNCQPQRGDAIINLEGSLIFPGLINAHDHLELNNFPRMKWQAKYANAAKWIADFQPRFGTDPALTVATSVPLRDRLLLGGLKNLLSGATTVCHHNPLYRELDGKFPVRVVRRYRYSHSLVIDGESVREEYRKTPKGWPWIIHACEGTDAEAAAEFTRLESWNCLGNNTILVHGAGLLEKQKETLVRRGGALVWCPSSNDFLLGTVPDITLFARARRVALGTDSRLSGERDLLCEIRFAASQGQVTAEELFRMVTSDAASVLRLPDVGSLQPGACADLVILKRCFGNPAASLLKADRSDIRLIILGGRARVGDADMLPAFAATGVRCAKIRLDRREKLMEKTLIDRIRNSSVHETGLEV